MTDFREEQKELAKTSENKKENSVSEEKIEHKGVSKKMDDDDDWFNDDEYGYDEEDSDLLETILQCKRSTAILKASVLRTVKLKPNKNDKYALREIIHKSWLKRKVPRLNNLLDIANSNPRLPNFSWHTLFRSLKDMDFTYSCRKNICAIVEKNEVILARRQYLRDIEKYREEGRPIYYLDEALVYVEKIVENEMVALNDNLVVKTHKKPNVKGKRLVICNIGSVDGFVPGNLMTFEYKKPSRYYHDEMNSDCFRDWLEMMLPNLQKNSVIVMDDAPYHLAKVDECPNPNWDKADVILWLKSKGVEEDLQPMVFPELMEIVNRIAPTYDKYVTDDLASEYNIIIMRLPTFHNDLNPMRRALSAVKNYVDLHNETFKVKDVRGLLGDAVENINNDMWKGYMNRTIELEKMYCKLDIVIDELMDITYLPPYNLDYNDDSDSESSDIF